MDRTARMVFSIFLLLASHHTTAIAQPAPATAPPSKPIDKPLEGISPEDLAEVVKATGFRAELKPFPTQNQPDGQIILTGMGGTAVTLAPVLCKDKLCRVIEFRARFANMAVTPAELNKWHLSKNFARAYQHTDGSVQLASEIDMGGGMTIKAVSNSVRRFEVLLGQFKTYDFKAATGGQSPPAIDRRPAAPGSIAPAERRI